MEHKTAAQRQSYLNQGKLCSENKEEWLSPTCHILGFCPKILTYALGCLSGDLPGWITLLLKAGIKSSSVPALPSPSWVPEQVTYQEISNYSHGDAQKIKCGHLCKVPSTLLATWKILRKQQLFLVE